MILTRQVLNQYLDLKNISDSKITQALNDSGFEVESVFSFNDLNTNIVIGKVVQKEKHPHSDKLSICLVDVNEPKLLTIVCGAKNVAVNRYVIVAKLGARLANGMLIEDRMILKQRSEGMICSLSELGLKDVDCESGIYLFPENQEYPLNMKNPLDFVFEADTAFDITVTYNRSDCLSVYELARELAAYFNIKLKPLVKAVPKQRMAPNKDWNQELKTTTFDNQFVKGLASVKVAINQNLRSPQWLISRLLYANIKPTNLVQDLLNYVTWETGQPLIGYDAMTITSPISISNHQNSQSEAIPSTDYLIQAGDKVLTVLGATTNDKFQINFQTKTVVVLSLNLNETMMRHQQKRHLTTENNHNLLCLTKPNQGHNLTIALQRFLDLLTKLTTITEISTIVTNQPLLSDLKIIKTTVKKQAAILGIDNLTTTKINKLLKPLGFVINSTQKALQLQVPKHRNDINSEADISEEIARRYGYNNIPDQQPFFLPNANLKKNWSEVVVTTITDYLLAQGIFEVKTYNLETTKTLEDFNFFQIQKPIKVLNPTSTKHEVFRVSLVNALLGVVQYNNLRKNYNLKMYTCENIYSDFKLHHQELTILLQGNWWSVPHLEREEKIDFMSVKGVLQAILMKLNFHDLEITYRAAKHEKLHPYLQADVFVNEIHIATIGKIHPEVTTALILQDDNFIISLNLSQLTKQFKPLIKQQPITKTMTSWFDFSLLISKNEKYDTIVKPLLSVSEQLVDLQLINIYEDDNKFGVDKKSITLRLFFNDHNRQFTDEYLKIQYNLFVAAIENMGIIIR